MPEHLRALAYILVMASGVFWILRRPLTARAMSIPDFDRRRNLWFALTLIAFFSYSFWIYLLLAAAVLVFASRRDPNPVALFVSVMFVVPLFSVQVPGFGLVNYLVEMDHLRLLALVILFPAAVRLLARSEPAPVTTRRVDWLLGAYCVYVFASHATVSSITGLMRQAFATGVDVWLPYYVVTRSVRTKDQLLDACAAFVMPLAVMGVIALFESARGWLLYESLRAPMGVPLSNMGMYILRDEGGSMGLLRANVTAGNSIAMGYLAMVALCLLLSLVRGFPSKLSRACVVACVLAGLLAALSRGPWVGAAVGIAIGTMIGPGWPRRLGAAIAVGVFAFPVLLGTTWGQRFIDLLPFVGTVEPGSVDYRQQLFEASMPVFWQSPMFGSFSYIYHPALEVMRQGQGIIDIVNTYLAIALTYGAAGLILFVAPFILALWMSGRARRELARIDLEAEAIGRALLAALLGVLLVIAACSSILHVPIVYWILLGLCTGYVTIAHGIVIEEARRRPAQAAQHVWPADRRGSPHSRSPAVSPTGN